MASRERVRPEEAWYIKGKLLHSRYLFVFQQFLKATKTEHDNFLHGSRQNNFLRIESS